MLIFTQFADTVHYLDRSKRSQIGTVAGVTGDTADPTALAWRSAPRATRRATGSPRTGAPGPHRHRRSQRGPEPSGCVDRGQLRSALGHHPPNPARRPRRPDRPEGRGDLCYTFLPADGVERIIRLRSRVRQRLTENAEVVGSDEAFFEGTATTGHPRPVHREVRRPDDEDDTETDLASKPTRSGSRPSTADPTLDRQIAALRPVVLSTNRLRHDGGSPRGFSSTCEPPRTTTPSAWIDQTARSVTESQLAILRAASAPRHPGLTSPRRPP